MRARILVLYLCVGMFLAVLVPSCDGSSTAVTSEAGLDGYLLSGGIEYEYAHAGPADIEDTSSGLMFVGQTKNPGGYTYRYMIWRSYISFNTSVIPDNATILAAELTLAWLSDNSTIDFSVIVYSCSYGSTLAADDWDAVSPKLEGTLLSTASYSTWHTMAVDTDAISPTTRTQYILRSSRDVDAQVPVSGFNESIGFASADYAGYEPTLEVIYTNKTYGSTYVGENQTLVIPASHIMPHPTNMSLEIYEYRFNSMNSAWVNLTAEDGATFNMIYPSATTKAWNNTVNVSGMRANTSYSVWFDVPIDAKMMCHISLYAINTYSDAPMQGFPWGSFRVFYTRGDPIQSLGISSSSLPTFDKGNSYEISEPTVYLDVGYYYAIAVLDWYGNVLAETVVVANTPERFVDINVPVWELAISNQCDDDIYVRIYDMSDPSTPMTLQCPAHWSRFRYMRESTYYIGATYLSGSKTNQTLWFNTTIDSATTFRINGTGIYELLELSSDIFTWQQIITGYLTPSLLVELENVPFPAPMTRSGSGLEGLTLVDPWLIMWGSVHIDAGTAYYSWVPGFNNSGMPGTVTILSDLVTPVIEDGTMWLNNTSGGWNVHSCSHVGVPIRIDQSSYTNMSGEPLWAESQGANVSGCLRDISFRYAEPFNWTLRATTGVYTTSVQVHNDFDAGLSITAPVFFVSFPPNVNADPSTVVMRDLDNMGAVLTAGVHYNIDSSGVHFSLSSLYPGQARNFTITFCTSNATIYKTVSCTLGSASWVDYAPGVKRLYRLGEYRNTDPGTIVGDMLLTFPSDVRDIDISSIRVYDIQAGAEVPTQNWYWEAGTIRIRQDQVGALGPTETRSFGVYYLEDSDSYADGLLGPLFYVGNTPISALLLGGALGVLLIVVGLLAPLKDRAARRALVLLGGTILSALLLIGSVLALAAASGG